MGISFLQLHRQFLLDPAGFRARQTAPVLLWVGAKVVQDDDDQWQPTQAGFNATRPNNGDVLVLIVEKQAAKANAFAMGITVGRVPTNDVVIDDGSLSRFHAYFQFDTRKSVWTLTDADSQNGTLLQGKKITGHQLIDDGAQITFGAVPTRFLSPDKLCAWFASGADPASLG